MSTQSLVRLPKYRLSHCHNIHPSTSYAYRLNPMTDHPWMHSADHAWPPGPCSRPQQPSVYMMACLPWYSQVSHSWTDSVKSHSISWTHGSSPLAAHTCSHAS